MLLKYDAKGFQTLHENNKMSQFNSWQAMTDMQWRVPVLFKKIPVNKV